MCFKCGRYVLSLECIRLKSLKFDPSPLTYMTLTFDSIICFVCMQLQHLYQFVKLWLGQAKNCKNA